MKYALYIENVEIVTLIEESYISLTLTMVNFLNGIFHLLILEVSIIILGISRWEHEVGQPTV